MIDFISDWAGGLIIAIVVITLLEMLLPNNKNKKYIKVLMGIYVIFCMISPIIKDVDSFSFDNIEEKIENYVDEQVKQTEQINQSSMDARLEKLYIEELEKTIANEVQSAGYFVKECDVKAVLNSDAQDAGINKIYLKINKSIAVAPGGTQAVKPVEIGINVGNKGNNKAEIISQIKNILTQKYQISGDKIQVDVY